MDSSSYKDITTSRGLKYHYFYSPPKENKSTLLLLHGFPSGSNDWRHQVAFFKEQGYGIIAPDMLGYGGTAKPTDPEAYQSPLICKDLIEILDAENLQKVPVIGHDWGAKMASRLANFYPERFTAFAFLAVSYVAPNPHFNLDAALALVKGIVGYEPFGYWKFLSEDGAEKVIEDHWESFHSALFPANPKLWVTDVAPTGTLKAWLEADRIATQAPWISEEDKDLQKKVLLKDGFKAPLCYYRILTSGLDAENDKSIALERYEIKQPVFYGAAKHDAIAIAALGKHSIAQHCKNATVHEFEAGHWLILQTPDEVNKALSEWLISLEL